MIYLILEYMEPLEVIIGRLPIPEWRLLIQPLIIPFGKLFKRLRPNLFQYAQVIVYAAAPNLTPRPLPEIKGCFPWPRLTRGSAARPERRRLVPRFDSRDVQEQGPDRIAVRIV